jgi:hypothetical protein
MGRKEKVVEQKFVEPTLQAAFEAVGSLLDFGAIALLVWASRRAEREAARAALEHWEGRARWSQRSCLL